MKKTPYNLRALAANVLNAVLEQGHSLSTLLPPLSQKIAERDRPLLQELCFGSLRMLPQLDWFIQQLMGKVFCGKQRLLHYLLMVGIYQLLYTRIPPHAALAETVSGAVTLKRPQLKGVINGVLRQFQRQQDLLVEQVSHHSCRYLHPSWLLERLKVAYPQQWEKIVAANNQRPPMWLRVNRLHATREQYLHSLEQIEIPAFAHPQFPDAICLTDAYPVTQLPGFEQGWITVQDANAQHCIDLLAPQDGEHILDLCCAPGGKTTYILEVAPKAKVLAVDIDEKRLARVKENLQRLRQQAEIKCGDGRSPETWAQGRCFDRILLDAPCSATGVIRRHPDIKWLRRDKDIAELATVQKEMMDAIWPYLKRGGMMLYATCSVLPEENRFQIQHFLTRHPDATLGTETVPLGLQYLPASQEGDGFFYAKLTKTS